MEFSTVIQAIGTVGFPIVAFFVAVYALKYAFDKSREDNKSALDQIANLTSAVNNNTVVLTHLVEKLESSVDDGK